MSLAARYLADKVAVVTSTRGIGLEIAKKLGRDGASVVVCSRKAANVEEAVKAMKYEGIDAAGVSANVGVAADRKKLMQFTIERFGKLDILVSNAGVSPYKGDMLDMTDSKWEKLLNINVRSSLEITQEALPHLVASGGGAVVFVSSIAGYVPMNGLGGYSVMKSALVGLNKALSQSLAHKNIRVNAIAPGIIRTDFSRALYENECDRDNLLNDIPLHRLGQAEECADAVAFLVSDQASYITGETIGVNGGMKGRI